MSGDPESVCYAVEVPHDGESYVVFNSWQMFLIFKYEFCVGFKLLSRQPIPNINFFIISIFDIDFYVFQLHIFYVMFVMFKIFLKCILHSASCIVF